jgi:hypothetical protein
VASGQVVRQLESNLEPLHRRLAEFNRARLNPRLQVSDWQQELRHEHELQVVEGHFIEAERALVRGGAERAPSQPHELLDWFEGLKDAAAAQDGRFFQWLAGEANRDQMLWFLSQELLTEADLDDLYALAQLKLPERPKLEMARNYWDEMGQGDASATRATLLASLISDLSTEFLQLPAWEILARTNLMLGLTANRRYAFQAIGALGVIELTSAGPARCVSMGLRRLGFSSEASNYFSWRARLCTLRSHAFNQGVILPLVAQDSRIATVIAEGALMRLVADGRCYQRYERELGLRTPSMH